MKRTTRRIFSTTPICSVVLLAAVTHGERRRGDGGHRARVRVRLGKNGEEWIGEREREQVGFVGVFDHGGAGSTRNGEAWRHSVATVATVKKTPRYYRLNYR